MFSLVTTATVTFRRAVSARIAMPRYFFDVLEKEKVARDDQGTDLIGPEAVRAAVMRFLPDIAREEIPTDGDYRSIVVLVTNEKGEPVYSASLSYTGVRLQR